MSANPVDQLHDRVRPNAFGHELVRGVCPPRSNNSRVDQKSNYAQRESPRICDVRVNDESNNDRPADHHANEHHDERLETVNLTECKSGERVG
jgi:hypothetical protein